MWKAFVYSVLYNNVVCRLYVRAEMLRICGKHLYIAFFTITLFADYMRGLKCYAYVESICITTSFRAHKTSLPLQKKTVMFLCVSGLHFASFNNFDILFWNCSDSEIFSSIVIMRFLNTAITLHSLKHILQNYQPFYMDKQ